MIEKKHQENFKEKEKSPQKIAIYLQKRSLTEC